MPLYIMNIIYKLHHTYNIDRILLNKAASLLIERSIASLSKNRLYVDMQSLDEQVGCFTDLLA